jgi:hypothetical protein
MEYGPGSYRISDIHELNRSGCFKKGRAIVMLTGAPSGWAILLPVHPTPAFSHLEAELPIFPDFQLNLTANI